MASRTFICDQVPILQAQITAYQDAAIALAANKIQSFSYDSGQTQESVTKMDVQKLHDVIDALYNRYAILCARCTGENVIIARPEW